MSKSPYRSPDLESLEIITEQSFTTSSLENLEDGGETSWD